jgi:hypothetical protein
VNSSKLDVRDQFVALIDALQRHSRHLSDEDREVFLLHPLRNSPTPEDYRWMAEILYRDGKVKIEGFEELYELHDIIEHGPD